MLVVDDVVNADGEVGCSGLRADVVSWCENLDAMGTLIFMALSLERWTTMAGGF